MRKIYFLYCFLTTMLTLQARDVKNNTKNDKVIIKNEKSIRYLSNRPYTTNLSLTPTNGILYVKKGANGNGSSWGNAAGELADALKWANENKTRWNATNKLKIYVAKGTYYPAYTPEDRVSPTDPKDLRDRTFLMVENVDLIGGFDPDNGILTENDKRLLPNRGDLDGTILSGDFNQDDIISSQNGVLAINNNNDNAYHVILAADSKKVNFKLDGFTVKGGNANGTFSIYVNRTAVSRSGGAGIYATSEDSKFYLINTIVRDNNEGGVYSISLNSSINLINSSVKENKGRAIHSYSHDTSTTTLVNSVINNNYSITEGSGIYSSALTSTINLINSNIIANRGLSIVQFNFGSNNKFNVHNSIIYNNKQENGTDFANANSWLGVYNTENALTSDIRYSFTQGNTDTSNNNILGNVDPMFVDLANGNYNLLGNSPLLDHGDNSLYSNSVLGNLLNINTDRDYQGSRRLGGNAIEIGAYERFSGPSIPTIVLSKESDSGYKDDDKITYEINPYFEGTADPNSLVTVYDTDGVTILGTATADQDGNWKLPVPSTTLSEGIHNITATATNNYGDVSEHSEPEIVTIDITAPIRTKITPPKKGIYKLGDELHYTVTYDEAIANSPLYLTLQVGTQRIAIEGTPNADRTSFDFVLVVDEHMFEDKGVRVISVNGDVNENLKVIEEDLAGNKRVPGTGGGGTPPPTEIIVDNRAADVEISATVSSPNINVGANVIYTITVQNKGTITAENVVINAILPSELKFVSTDQTTGNFNSATNTWTDALANLAVNETKVITIVAQITGSSEVIFNANVDTDTYEVNKANNTTTVTFTSNRLDQNLIFDPLADMTYLDEDIFLEATTDTGLEIFFESADPTIAQVYQDENGKWKLHANKPGSTVIKAYHKGDATYLPQDATQPIRVNKANQVINWTQNLIIGCEGDTVIELNGTATSGLNVIYNTSNTSVVTINGKQLSVVGAGSATVTATQPGNEYYNAATPVTNTFTQYLKGSIKEKWNNVLVFDNSSNNFVKYQWYKDGAKIEGATNQEYYSGSQPLSGTYHVIVTDVNGNEFITCPLTVVANGDVEGIRVVPNPVAKGAALKFLASYSDAQLKGARLVIFDLTGKVYSEINNVTKETTVQAPVAANIYIANLFLSDGKKASTKIVVY